MAFLSGNGLYFLFYFFIIRHITNYINQAAFPDCLLIGMGRNVKIIYLCPCVRQYLCLAQPQSAAGPGDDAHMACQVK